MSATQAPTPRLTNVGTRPATPRKLFVNIPVSDLQRSIDFFEKLGFDAQQVFVIGDIAAICLVLYLIPRTAPSGAVLWTGYFGGAILLHFRAGNPLFTHILPPIYVSILIWGSLYLRDPRVRAVVRG
jgi:catechol 2,3-dioxygenase-like lactoylglutathione lyase family enzyme